MKVSCEIIKDLLPLYHDGACSKESCALVEAHLRDCQSCKEELGNYQAIFDCSASNLKDAKPIQAIASTWKKDKKVAFAKGTLMMCGLACLACIIAYNAIGTTVLEDGTLVEPFGFIPLFFLFALVGLVSGITLAVLKMAQRRKR